MFQASFIERGSVEFFFLPLSLPHVITVVYSRKPLVSAVTGGKEGSCW